MLAACSGNAVDAADASDVTADASDAKADASPDFDHPRGRIAILTYGLDNSVYLQGHFSDGPDLELRVESDRIGACRLMTFTPSFCDPACTDFDLCVDSECRSWPARLDKGPIEWTWPGGQETVNPTDINFYRASGTFTQHGEHSLTVEGRTLRVESMSSLEQVGDWYELIKNRSGDAVLRWSNPVDGARVRLDMTDCRGSHGAIGEAEIQCEGPDTGELTLPGAFLDVLDAGDWTHGECGSHAIIRYAYAAADGDSFHFEAQSFGGFFYRPDWRQPRRR